MRKIILTDDQKQKIQYMFYRGQSRKAIAKELNLSDWSVKKVVQHFTKPRIYKHVGKRFGKLTVISKRGTHKNGCPIVVCQCDCGNLTDVIVSNLTKKKSATVSCGCYNRDKNLSKNPWLTEFNAYLCNVVKKRNLSFKLSVQDFQKLCSSNCYYCNVSPSQKMDVGREMKNGIDRIDNSIGYVLSNCVPCCWTCNKMKSNMTQLNFLNHIKQILHYQKIG